MDVTPSGPEFGENIDHRLDPAEVMQAIAAAMEEYFKGDGEFKLDLRHVKLRIYLDGPKWHGLVDKPVAEFLIQVEKKLRTEFEKLEIKLPKWERGLIALEVKDGSWEAFLGYTTEAVEYFKTLAPSYQTVAAGAVMATVGALASVRRRIHQTISPLEAQKALDLAIARDQQDALEGLDAEEKASEDSGESNQSGLADEKIDTLSKLEAIQMDSTELQRPIRTLLGLMTERDVVVLPAEENPLKHAAAIQTLERSARTPTKKRPTYYIDQHYIVEALHTAGPPAQWKVRIQYAGTSFQAKISTISEYDLARLTSIYEDAFSKGGTPSADLQVTAEFDAKGVPKAAIVIGLGKPRDNNTGLSSAISFAKNPTRNSGKN